jgi:hypothetical protein
MENLPLAIALSAWFTYTVWAYYTIRELQQQNRALTSDLNAEVAAHMLLLVAAEELISNWNSAAKGVK